MLKPLVHLGCLHTIIWRLVVVSISLENARSCQIMPYTCSQQIRLQMCNMWCTIGVSLLSADIPWVSYGWSTLLLSFNVYQKNTRFVMVFAPLQCVQPCWNHHSIFLGTGLLVLGTVWYRTTKDIPGVGSPDGLERCKTLSYTIVCPKLMVRGLTVIFLQILVVPNLPIACSQIGPQTCTSWCTTKVILTYFGIYGVSYRCLTL